MSASYNSRLMTIQYCVEVCRGLSQPLALLQNDKCFCQPNLDALRQLPSAVCRSACAANPLQACGDGEHAMSGYDVGLQKSDNPKSLGKN